MSHLLRATPRDMVCNMERRTNPRPLDEIVVDIVGQLGGVNYKRLVLSKDDTSA